MSLHESLRGALAACCLLSACAAGDADLPPGQKGGFDPPGAPAAPGAADPDDAPVPSARERLGGGVGFLAAPAGGYFDLHATAEGMAGPARVTLPVLGGRLSVRVRGEQASIDALSIVLGDVTVPLPGGLDPLVLRDVRLELAAAAQVPGRFPSDDTLVLANVTPTFVLAWSLVTPSGRTVALGPQRIEGIALSLHVQSLRDGSLVARLEGRCTGLLWQWAQILSLSDALFDVTFAEQAGPARLPLEAPPAR